MSIFARILVPVDGSPPSDQAVTLALQVARACGSTLTFCHVVDRSRIAVETANIPFADPSPLIADANAEGEKILAAAVARAGGAGLAAHTVLCDGEPISTLA